MLRTDLARDGTGLARRRRTDSASRRALVARGPSPVPPRRAITDAARRQAALRVGPGDRGRRCVVPPVRAVSLGAGRRRRVRGARHASGDEVPSLRRAVTPGQQQYEQDTEHHEQCGGDAGTMRGCTSRRPSLRF